MLFFMVSYKKQFICINHWGIVIIPIQIMCAVCVSHYMDLNKHPVLGISDLLIMSCLLVSQITNVTTHYLFIKRVRTWLTFCSMLISNISFFHYFPLLLSSYLPSFDTKSMTLDLSPIMCLEQPLSKYHSESLA